MKKLSTILISLAFLGLSMSSVWAQSTYIITGSGTQFTATKDGAPVSNNQPIQTVIDAIKLDASGSDCIIQFGNGTSTLNTETANITFDGGTTGEAWGLITLTGKLTSACSGHGNGVVYMTNGVSINSQADITSTSTSDFIVTLYNDSTGTLTISGGTVSAIEEFGIAIYNIGTGTLNISGGTVSATGHGGAAIDNNDGDINISSGTVSATENNSIAISNWSEGNINISGGVISAIGHGSAAIVNNSTGTLNISGGTISATGENSTAIGNWGDGDINISDGTVSTTEYDGIAIDNGSEGKINISGGTISATGVESHTIFNNYTGAININGGTISADGNESVTILNWYTGAININGGTISATGVTSIAIDNRDEGEINISNGTVSATEDASTAILDRNNGEINISGGTISATSGMAIESFGTVNISGGIVSATTKNAVRGEGTVNISGGFVATTDNAIAVFIAYGTLTMSGGIVAATTREAIFNEESTVTITDGIVFAYGTIDEDVIFGNYTQSGNAVIVAWDEAAGTTTYEFNTDDDIYKFPTTATAVWAKQSGSGGIAVDNEGNTGFIPIAGITITGLNSFTITASVEGNTGGTISPEGDITVEEGDNIAFTMSPNSGYSIEYVLVDGVNVGTDATYQFIDVTSDHTIAVKFKPNTAIEEWKVESGELKIYPNPTRGQLQVTIADQARNELQVTSYEIFDVMGKKLLTSPLSLTSPETTLNISHLPNGIYFLKITTENGIITKKIIKN